MPGREELLASWLSGMRAGMLGEEGMWEEKERGRMLRDGLKDCEG